MDTSARAPQGDWPADARAPQLALAELDHDLELLARARRGDGPAFARLLAPHLDRAFRLAARLTRDRALAEDAVQEALVIVHRDLQSFRAGSSLRAFLCGTTMRAASTLMRSARRRTAREQVAAVPSGFLGPEAAVQALELQEALDQALAALPERRRQAVLLRLDADLSHADIGAVLGTTQAAARQLVYEAQKALRLALSGREEAP